MEPARATADIGVGRTPVVPVVGVMLLLPDGRSGAAGERTGGVAVGEHPAEDVGGEPLRAAVGEWPAVVGDDRDDVGIGEECPQGVDRDVVVGFGVGHRRSAGASRGEVVEVEVDVEAYPARTRRRSTAADQLDQRGGAANACGEDRAVVIAVGEDVAAITLFDDRADDRSLGVGEVRHEVPAPIPPRAQLEEAPAIGIRSGTVHVEASSDVGTEPPEPAFAVTRLRRRQQVVLDGCDHLNCLLERGATEAGRDDRVDRVEVVGTQPPIEERCRDPRETGEAPHCTLPGTHPRHRYPAVEHRPATGIPDAVGEMP